MWDREKERKCVCVCVSERSFGVLKHCEVRRGEGV